MGMLLKNFRISVLLMIIIAQVPAYIGCATAPVAGMPEEKVAVKTHPVSSETDRIAAETEKSAVKASMENALFCEAEKYAEADMNAAKKILETAETKMKDGRYVEAKQSYISAKAAFDRAAVNAVEGRKTVAAEANTAIANLEKAWENLIAASRNVKNMMKDREMKADWSAFTKSFAEDFKATKEKIATDPAGAKANIDELLAIIERWETAFREVEAAYSKQKPVKTKPSPPKKTNK